MCIMKEAIYVIIRRPYSVSFLIVMKQILYTKIVKEVSI